MPQYMKLVSGVLIRDNQVLLGLRKNTQHFPDYWALPGGRLEIGENFVDALRRELYEEIGVQMINGQNITTLYDHEQQIEHEVFMVNEWRGEAENLEPELCEKIDWFTLDSLPKPVTPASLKILRSLEHNTITDR